MSHRFVVLCVAAFLWAQAAVGATSTATVVCQEPAPTPKGTNNAIFCEVKVNGVSVPSAEGSVTVFSGATQWGVSQPHQPAAQPVPSGPNAVDSIPTTLFDVPINTAQLGLEAGSYQLIAHYTPAAASNFQGADSAAFSFKVIDVPETAMGDAAEEQGGSLNSESHILRAKSREVIPPQPDPNPTCVLQKTYTVDIFNRNNWLGGLDFGCHGYPRTTGQNYGYSWTDTLPATASVRSVAVNYTRGPDCSESGYGTYLTVSAVSLNGNFLGNLVNERGEVPSSYCYCDTSLWRPARPSHVLPAASGAYVRGGLNLLTIQPDARFSELREGLGALSITVTYDESDPDPASGCSCPDAEVVVGIGSRCQSAKVSSPGKGVYVYFGDGINSC